MAMFGMITQLYTHTGLAPQQPGLQDIGAAQLAVTPALAPTAAPVSSTTPETTFSMSALLCLPVVHSSHHCQRLHSSRTLRWQFSQSPSPSYHRHYLQGEEERSPFFSSRHSRQLQSDVDTSSAEPVTTSTDPLPGSASTRASTTATPPVSSNKQLPMCKHLGPLGMFR